MHTDNESGFQKGEGDQSTEASGLSRWQRYWTAQGKAGGDGSGTERLTEAEGRGSSMDRQF